MSLADFSTEMQRRIFGISVDDLRRMVSDSRNELADLKVVLNRLEREVAKLRIEVGESSKPATPIEDLSLDEVLRLHAGCHDALERFEIQGGGPRKLRDAAKPEDLDTLVATIKNLLKDQAA